MAIDDFLECTECEGTGTVIVDVWTGWQFGASRVEECEVCNGNGGWVCKYEWNGQIYRTTDDVEAAILEAHPELYDDSFKEFFEKHVRLIADINRGN